MTTEARVKANRLNAQKSTGPHTTEGKSAVAQNAVKHGLSGQCDVIRGEDQKEFEQYREELFWELDPLGVMQSRLVERIVSLAWRLRRAERIHNEAFDALLEKEASSSSSWLTGAWRSRGSGRSADGAEADLSPGTIAAKDFSNHRVLDRLLMYERRIESSLYRTMNELRKLQHEQESQARAPARSRSLRYCAKQSQSLEEVSSLEFQVSSKQDLMPSPATSQFPPDTSNSPSGVIPGASDCAKQSQSAAEEASSEDHRMPGPPTSNFTLPTSNPASGGTPNGSGSGVSREPHGVEFAGSV